MPAPTQAAHSGEKQRRSAATNLGESLPGTSRACCPVNPNAARRRQHGRDRDHPDAAEPTAARAAHRPPVPAAAPSSAATANDSRPTGHDVVADDDVGERRAITERERRTETPGDVHAHPSPPTLAAVTPAIDRRKQGHPPIMASSAARRNARSSSRRCRRPIAVGCQPTARNASGSVAMPVTVA